MSPKLAALRQKQAQLNALQQEIRQLHTETGTQEQILVHVQLLEVSLTKMRRFGSDLPLKSGYLNASDLGQFLAGAKPGKTVPYSPSGKSKANESTSIVDWLLSNNIGRILSEPNIIVVEGRPASFHMGGEVPIPAKDNPKSVEYRPTGTELDVLATCLGEERVRLDIRARISYENYANGFQFGEMKLPIFNVRNFSSTVDSSFGQACLLIGATENRTEEIKTKFGVRQEINEICSMLIVTPERIDGVETAQRQVGQAAK
jgi:Flp pilus assembly secretin CpaC